MELMHLKTEEGVPNIADSEALLIFVKYGCMLGGYITTLMNVHLEE